MMMQPSQRGFTLIELMVGVALGLLATVVIATVLLQSEGNKRTTTSGADAQVMGAAALFTLQRDIQQAGYGVTSVPGSLGCPLAGSFDSNVVLNPAVDRLAPVVIDFGATADSDTITVMASGKAGSSVPINLAAPHAQIDSTFTVASNFGVRVNDLLLAVPATWDASNGCSLFMATAATPTNEVPHAATIGWNVSSAIFPSTGYAAGSRLVNLGAAPVRRRYTVNPATWSLQMQDTMAITAAGKVRAPQDMFSQIVLVKALYGKAAVPGGPVTSYSKDTPTTDAGWRLVRSVRVAVVARSNQYEKTEVTTDPPQWEVGALAAGTVACRGKAGSLCLPLTVSTSGPSEEWKHYRYKIFDTVVPLRNVVWNP